MRTGCHFPVARLFRMRFAFSSARRSRWKLASEMPQSDLASFCHSVGAKPPAGAKAEPEPAGGLAREADPAKAAKRTLAAPAVPEEEPAVAAAPRHGAGKRAPVPEEEPAVAAAPVATHPRHRPAAVRRNRQANVRNRP